MAKFNFPISESEFEGMITADGKKLLDRKFDRNESKDGVKFAYSCVRMGWMNKQHHKESQAIQKERNERIKIAMKDPAIRKQILGEERGK